MLVWHGPEQSESMDPCPLACLAHGPPHPRRCPSPFSDSLGAALRCLRGRRGHRGHAAGGGGVNARRRRTTRTTSVPPVMCIGKKKGKPFPLRDYLAPCRFCPFYTSSN